MSQIADAGFRGRPAALVLATLAGGALFLSGCAGMNDHASSSNGFLPPPAHMEIVAHRGASDVAPENTVAAYKRAWAVGADAGEVDIYLTSDNRVVCMHDKTTKRTANGDLEMKSSTFEDLRKLDAGSWKSTEYAGEPIPLLSEVLDTLPPGKIMYVEVKCGPEVLPFLDKVLTKSENRAQTVIIGFDLPTMAEAKKLMPDRPVLWLRGARKDEETKALLSHDLGWIDQVKLNGLDGLDVDYRGVTPHFADAVRAAGLRFLVWTVDEEEDASRMRACGAEGLTTNRVEAMKGLR